MKILPAIDLYEGRAVRLRQGRFDAVTVYRDDPVRLAAEYSAASWLHLVDLEGSRVGRPVHAELIGEIAKVPGVRVQVGGGLRSRDDVRAVLDAGAARVVVGSMAVRAPDAFAKLLEEVGPDRVVLAADVRLDDSGEARVATGAWTEMEDVTAMELVARFPSLRHVLCTDIGRDGMLSGPNEALYARLASLEVELQASGGVSSLEDLRLLRQAGASAAVVGKALLEGRFTLTEALKC
jgi:phosphoribosylformimino-5-aminoimidazole carboxamide ribotide isomerase